MSFEILLAVSLSIPCTSCARRLTAAPVAGSSSPHLRAPSSMPRFTSLPFSTSTTCPATNSDGAVTVNVSSLRENSIVELLCLRS